MWGNLPEELANNAVCFLACQQLLWWIQRREEETTRFGSVIRIYNPLSQHEEDRIDERLVDAVDMLEIVPANNHVTEKIMFSVDSRYLSE